jgi:hypothetical protein
MREVASIQAHRASLFAIWTAALLIIASALMLLLTKDYPPRVLPASIHPGLAMELPHSIADIVNILGGPNAVDPPNAVRIMRNLQYWDMGLYIPSYFLFFVAAAFFLVLHKPGWWRGLGYVAIALVLVGAAFDYLEDFAILHAISTYTHRALSIADAARISRWGRLNGAQPMQRSFAFRRCQSIFGGLSY